jgi:hypothetical protein
MKNYKTFQKEIEDTRRRHRNSVGIETETHTHKKEIIISFA